jgi:hypothetical protein
MTREEKMQIENDKRQMRRVVRAYRKQLHPDYCDAVDRGLSIRWPNWAHYLFGTVFFDRYTYTGRGTTARGGEFMSILCSELGECP